MSELNLEFFKKRPSEELLEQVEELVENINPKYKSLLTDLNEEEED
jgi:hypothetical protein